MLSYEVIKGKLEKSIFDIAEAEVERSFELTMEELESGLLIKLRQWFFAVLTVY